MKPTYLVLCATLIAATTTLAHQGVQNPAVMARMNGMSAIAKNMKTIGQMAKGETAFDAAAAKSAAAAIAEHAAETPDLFKANETDPKSEARSEIWSNFDDFTAKALELETIASDLSRSITTPKDLAAAIGTLGANCKACHSTYRQ